jgi:type II restriction enzyme
MSKNLSEKITNYYVSGHNLNDESKENEHLLNIALQFVIKYTETKLKSIFGNEVNVFNQKQITLYECQMIWSQFNNIGEDYIVDEKNKNFSMKPDGGMLYTIINGNKHPLLITEDKTQGTNDIRFKDGKNKQATGNAIERGIKNIRGAEMLFDNLKVFPYVIFCSGCDFYHTETISNRLEMGNYGVKNHNIFISKEKTNEEINTEFNEIVQKINIKKRYNNKSIASIFVKSHKWNEMEHGSSRWSVDEIIKICVKIIDNVVDELTDIYYKERT